MAKKRAKISDRRTEIQAPASRGQFEVPGPRETAETQPADPQPTKRSSNSRSNKNRLSGRATYDIGAELKEAIRQESINLGVPASQLAKYILLYGWNDYVEGVIPPPTLVRSGSPAFQHNIDFGS